MSQALLLVVSLSASAALKIAITGTNSGIGQSAAKQLLEGGHTIYHACRTAEGAERNRRHQKGIRITAILRHP